ncbi:LamG-like jellyroll fold domain-containing protein [Candidatus Neomarinimicrobiota bacterium]
MRGLHRHQNHRYKTLVRNLLILSLLPIACEPEPDEINSVVLTGGAFVQINNRQVAGAPLDSTSLAVLNLDVFSLEIRAAGERVPSGVTESPTLFMVSDDQGDNEIGIYRPAADSNRIFVFIGEVPVGSYIVPDCDWHDPEVFTQIVLTYDGNVARVYGNGQLLDTNPIGINLDIGLSHALIGADWDAPNDPSTLSNFWYGAIDEVRLWTKILPGSEMEFRYRNPDKLTRNYSPTGLNALIGLWRFNEEGGDGDQVDDDSGKGNHAILNANGGTISFTSDGTS